MEGLRRGRGDARGALAQPGPRGAAVHAEPLRLAVKTVAAVAAEGSLFESGRRQRGCLGRRPARRQVLPHTRRRRRQQQLGSGPGSSHGQFPKGVAARLRDVDGHGWGRGLERDM